MRGQQWARTTGDVDRRLARLLAGEPRHAGRPVEGVPDEPVLGEPVSGADRSAELVTPPAHRDGGGGRSGGDDQPPDHRREGSLCGPAWLGGRRFDRPQVVVVAVIVVAGLVLAGWAVLRARPVAIATPGVIIAATAHPVQATAESPTAAPPTAAPTGSGPSSAAAPTAPAGSVPAAAPAASPTVTIEVHVLGAVRHPGVVALPSGARVQDALRGAGGVTRSAALGTLNLAQPLGDGQQIVVARSPGHTRVRNPVPPMDAATTDPAITGAGGPAPGSSPGRTPVDINTATAEELDALPGVGPVTAEKILDWRRQNGRFTAVDELQEVDGIGPKTFADLKPWVTL